MRTRAQAADLSGVDLPYLATTYGVPEGNIQNLLTTPNVEQLQAFLTSLTTKGEEFDALKAEKLKVEVELENTVRTLETKARAQKATLLRQTKEEEELRTKLNEAESASQALSTELQQLRSSTSDSTAESTTLRQRIETLEASNRDALALVESKSTEKDRLATELSEQHGKLLGLRREISQLEERNQALENAASSQKFKEQSLHQEIDLLKRNNEWHSNELKTRGQDHAKFRKDRTARIASLQRELEDSTANVDVLKRTETTLRHRFEELQAKADEAFTRVASLQEDVVRKEQDFRTELDSTRRLADLQGQNATTHKARLLEVQGEVDEIKENAADEIGRMQAEVETERSDKEHAEKRVAELELTLERLEQQTRPSRPGTPIRNGNVEPATPGRLGSRAASPNAMPGSLRKTVSGLSFTQLYSNYTEVQQELEAERRRTQKLSTAMDELITEVETRSPEILELKTEQERLEAEVLNFSRMLDDTKEVRDKAVKESERFQGQAEAGARENDILRQQLRDLSTQIKILLVEVQSRDQGLGEMSAQERFELERAARGELEDDALDHMTSTGRLISERLVIFRNINELQTKNEDLLRVTRQLGEQMEGEEAREKARQSAADAQENEELKKTLARYKDELTATATQIDSYIKERDMFRRMLQHRGQIAPDADLQSMFGQSIGPGTPQRNGSMPPPTPRSKDVEDLNKVLKEQQTFLDQYRNESATDRRILREQVDTLAREKSNLQADIARAQSQLILASERYEMLQSNFTALRNENSELQKRSQQMAENAAKQDLRTQQVAEELVEARSMADSLRNENANSKAEKELWKRIEERLMEDNKGLVDERSRLNKLVSDLQNLQNERELADSETRRRLHSKIETLESELVETKRKLESEAEDSKRATLRREYDEGQSRTRIDDLVKSLSNVREEFVAAKATRDQLQTRVEEMRIELRSAEEKVNALQPRPTPRADPQQSDEARTNGDTDELPAEQRLAFEASELRRDLELARNELENVKQQVEQYRSIAQSTEEELASFNNTSEQYKEETDRIISEKDSRIKELDQRIEDLSAELTTTNSELSQLRTKADDSNRALDELKASFEDEAVRMRDDADRYTEEKILIQADLKAQAEIAQQAQQSYENELLKHAEAAKNLQTVRKEYNELRTEVAEIRAKGEASMASLEQGEESWAEQRERFERELDEAKTKREGVDKQNKLLHQQMESFSAELATLRTGRATVLMESNEGSVTQSPSRNTDGNSLQEVIKFLRREKEIVDVQYELSIQEAKRLQQQLDYANSQLEETQQKLADERRHSADKAANEGSTSKLMQTINELNLFRESSTTLRNEARQAREKFEEKSMEVTRLLAEMDPLKGRVGELEGELESREGEVKLLQDDRDHWRERTQNIISKYDRVDPAELEALKAQLESLKVEKQILESEQAPLKEQIDGLEAKVQEGKDEVTAQMTDRLQKFKEQAKEQNRKQNDKARQLAEELNATRAERDRVADELESTKAELEQTKTLASANQTLTGDSNELDAIKLELERARTALNETQAGKLSAGNNDDEEGEVNEEGTSQDQSETLGVMRTLLTEAETNANQHRSHAETLSSQVQTLQARVEELEGQIDSLRQQLEATRQGQVEPVASAELEALEKLRQELTTAQQEVNDLRTNASVNASSIQPSEVQLASGTDSVSNQVAEQVAKLRVEMEQQHALAIQQMEEDRDKKIENMKSNLRRQLKEQKEQMQVEIRNELVEQHSAELQKLKTEHEAAIQKLNEEHQEEIARLKKDGRVAIQKAEGGDASVKTESVSAPTQPEITEEQMMELVKTNARMKSIVSNNIRKNVAEQTEKFTKVIADKDAEISALKEVQVTAETNPAVSDAENGGFVKQLESLKQEKEAAVKQAIDNAEKKAKVQISQRDMFKVKLEVVRKAAQDTPEKPVKEVWEVADKTRIAPKPAATTAVATGSSSLGESSPAPAKPQVPASPVPAQTPGSMATQTPEQIEAAKIRARQERFGAVPPPHPSISSLPPKPVSTFGLPSTFGQPSNLAPPARRPSAPGMGPSPNPEAPSFAPGTDGNAAGRPNAGGGAPPPARASTGIPQPRGGSQLPTPGRGGAAGAGRGGAPSGIARAGGNLPRGRGGAPAAGRGGPPNAGQKRGHDGSGGGGDDKRQRGGGGAGGGS